MNQAFHLYRLQQIDSQLDQLEASLAEIKRLLEGDETVIAARQTADEAAKFLQKAQQNLKHAETAVKDQQIKIAQAESTLYSGNVRNPKELQDLQRDIASLKKFLGALEDKQLELMIAAEEAESQEQGAQTALNLAQARFAEQSAGWLGQKEQFEHLKERLKTERSAAIPLVDAESMKVYENLRRRKRGVAVSMIEEGSCTVCGTEIRPSELQEARNSPVLVYCTSCGRILYAG